MSFESFKKFFNPSPETVAEKSYDAEDYEFLLSKFEDKFREVNKESPRELEEILQNFEATFGETQMGKDHFHLTNEKTSLLSAGNPSGEVGTDLGKINTLEKQISEIESLDEFKKYQSLKGKIQESINNIEGESKQVA